MKNILKVLLPISYFPNIVCFCSCGCHDEVKQMYDKLISLENVTRVQIIRNVPNLKAKFIVYFKQKLDWFGNEDKTFEQRIEFGFRDWNAINVMFIRGYALKDQNFDKDSTNEVVQHFNSNFINVEYRYFAESAPSHEGIDPLHNADYWKYLNGKQGVEDFHNILCSLKSILNGKWIIMGSSKGGQTTNTFAMLHPEDASTFLAFVPPTPYSIETNPLSPTDESMKMMNWCYNGIEISDQEQLQKRRESIAIIQNFVLDNQTILNEKLWNEVDSDGILFNKFIQDNKIYLLYVILMDYGGYVWQVPHWDDVISLANQISSNPTGSALLDSVYNEVLAGMSLDHSLSDPSYAYTIQGRKEMGIYSFSFDIVSQSIADNLNQSITKDQIKAKFVISPSDETLFFQKTQYNNELLSLQWDDWLKNNIIDWFTKGGQINNAANVMEFHGSVDPWRAYYKQVEDWKKDNSLCDNIDVYLCNEKSHSDAQISALPEEEQNVVWNKITNWLNN